MVMVVNSLVVAMTSEDIGEATYPGELLKYTIFFGPVLGLVFGLSMIGPIVGLFASPILGLISGVVIGLGLGWFPIIQHYLLRLLLAQYRLLPWQLFPFLQYAVDLTFMRRVGGSYSFIHRLLMEHFAEMKVEYPSTKPSAIGPNNV